MFAVFTPDGFFSHCQSIDIPESELSFVPIAEDKSPPDYALSTWDGVSVVFSTDVTPKDYAAQIKAEVQRRILSHASYGTQTNMLGAHQFGEMTAEEEAAFLAGRMWVKSMQLAGRVLAEENDPSYAEDHHWPDPPPEAVELAAKY